MAAPIVVDEVIFEADEMQTTAQAPIEQIVEVVNPTADDGEDTSPKRPGTPARRDTAGIVVVVNAAVEVRAVVIEEAEEDEVGEEDVEDGEAVPVALGETGFLREYRCRSMLPIANL